MWRCCGIKNRYRRGIKNQLDVTCCLYFTYICSTCTTVQHTTSAHTPQDQHLAAPRTPYAAFVKEIINSIAPEDGRISPKHVELNKQILHQVGNNSYFKPNARYNHPKLSITVNCCTVLVSLLYSVEQCNALYVRVERD